MKILMGSLEGFCFVLSSCFLVFLNNLSFFRVFPWRSGMPWECVHSLTPSSPCAPAPIGLHLQARPTASCLLIHSWLSFDTYLVPLQHCKRVSRKEKTERVLFFVCKNYLLCFSIKVTHVPGTKFNSDDKQALCSPCAPAGEHLPGPAEQSGHGEWSHASGTLSICKECAAQ